jgi:hypothetical protein
VPNPKVLYISMRAEDAARLLADAADAAKSADGRDGAFEVRLPAEWNDGGQVEIVFDNDDMERDEMTGRTIADFDLDR